MTAATELQKAAARMRDVLHSVKNKDEVKISGWDHQPTKSTEALGGQETYHEEQQTEPLVETDH